MISILCQALREDSLPGRRGICYGSVFMDLVHFAQTSFDVTQDTTLSHWNGMVVRWKLYFPSSSVQQVESWIPLIMQQRGKLW